ncbi:MAG: ATP-dependent RNA helicase HrpA [Nitrospirae bacterium]|nr:ATP-dependent RNA helicase HrpA [Magnetococcales bacterium]
MSDLQQWKARMAQLAQITATTMAIDRHRLQRRRFQLSRRPPTEPLPFPALEKLEKQVQAAVERHQRRNLVRPTPSYTMALPISEHRQEISRLISTHQVVVICSETGSGKTTQLPKLCLDLQRGSAGFIGMTQPRRIAARSLTHFLAKDLGCAPADEWVGYKMRFDGTVRESSFVKIMTDGLLLAELTGDPLLLHYDTLIIDEAHERSLNIDFLLGYLKTILPKRPDLKIIISSATLDHEKFSRHFDQAPVMMVPGRTYPVEVHYRPLQPDPAQETEGDLAGAILASIRHLHRTEVQGDILVFLPGESDIREMSFVLRKQWQSDYEILPLHARLASRDQDRIFTPGTKPRIILATNVAETSITVPGIRHIIDPGLAKIKRHHWRGSIQRLSLEKISRASADQRKGRSGRVGPGTCIRLYTQEDYEARPLYTDPEIVRTSLAATILVMQAQGLGHIEQFPFMDPPSPSAVQEGWRLLAELDAVDTQGNLTEVGKKLARLPVDPRIGRMILAAPQHQCLDEILIIAAALSIPDPREWPLNRLELAEESHLRFADKNSDFIMFLNIWSHLENLRKTAPSKTNLNNTLKGEFIVSGRVREWWEIYAQLKKITKEMGYSSQPAQEIRYAAIHKAILAGHFSMVGLKKQKNEFSGCRDTLFHIHPGSALFKKSPSWIVTAEMVETSRLYARICARVEPEWIEEAAGEACKKEYYEAYWDNKLGKVMAFQKVSYGGLPLIVHRKVHFGPIDPIESRRIFIQEALVGHRLRTEASFLAHNRELIREIRDQEHKARRRDLLIGEAELFALYERLVPQTTYCASHFLSWYLHGVKENPHLLHFAPHELLRHHEQATLQEQFPGHLSMAGQTFSLEYHFNPGAGEDGISVLIPLAAIHQCHPHPFEWLVPGMLLEKVTALLKALPKAWRKQLVPVPETAAMCLDHLAPYASQSLTLALAKVLQNHRDVVIPAEAWRDLVIADHLRMNFKVIADGGGQVLHQGRDLESLKNLLGPKAKQEFRALLKSGIEQESLTRWTFGDLPATVEIPTGGGVVIGFPALVDETQSVSLQVMDHPGLAEKAMRRGMIRLFALHLPQQVKSLRPILKFSAGAVLIHLPTQKRGSLTSEVIDLVFDRVFLRDSLAEITSKDIFQERIREGQGKVFREAEFIRCLVEEIIEGYRIIQLLMKTGKSDSGIIPELKEQLGGLIGPEFLWKTPFNWLRQYPRYLKAIHKRLERRDLSPLKDREKGATIKPFEELLRMGQVRLDKGETDPELETFRWMVEEFRVSLFAQELGTSLPVSPKRLQEQWRKVFV